MADQVLERQAYVSTEEVEHERNISENYRKLLDETISGPHANGSGQQPRAEMVQSVATSVLERHEEVAGLPLVHRDLSADTHARLADYEAPPAPSKSKKVLFEDFTYQRGQYTGARNATLVESVMAPVTAQPAEQFAPATAVEDDSLPTARTMQHRTVFAEQEKTEQGVGFWAALTTKTKLALVAVAATIVIAIMLVCVNSAILSSLNTDIANKRVRLDKLVRQAQQIEDRIEELTDPDYVDSWAEQNGMVKG